VAQENTLADSQPPSQWLHSKHFAKHETPQISKTSIQIGPETEVLTPFDNAHWIDIFYFERKTIPCLPWKGIPYRIFAYHFHDGGRMGSPKCIYSKSKHGCEPWHTSPL
jgi:hypothetical protein